MNYWILTTEYPPLFGGGISTYCDQTARMLCANGDTVTVFLPDDKINDFEITTQGSIRVVLFNSNRSKLAAYLGHSARVSYEFATILKEFVQKEGKPDCIESQEYLAISYYLLQFKLLGYQEFSDIPVVLVLHSPAFLYLYYNREGIYEFPNYWTGEMEISCIKAADHIIAPSAYIVNEIKKHISVNDSKISVLRNPFGVETGKELNNRIERNKIVFYGKLSPQKGVFELLTYFKSMWDQGFQHALHIIGGTDKVYYPEMKTMGQLFNSWYAPYIQKGLLHFVGKVAPAERDRLLSDAHVILIPSTNDNLPYAAIEAMAIGKTVLASIQGGQAEIITDGSNGFLFDHQQPQSFENALQKVLDLDNDSIATIGSNAASFIAEELNFYTIYKKKMAIITRLLNEKQQSAIFPFARPFAKEKALPHTHSNSLLSVVIPYYNMGEFIDECISSVLQSAHPDIEVIVVNDGSTEQSSILALQKYENDSRIRIVHKQNEGLAETRNYGASLARGEFLAFLDADDMVRSDYYSRAIHVLSRYENVFFTGSWVQYFGQKKDIWPTWNPEPPYILLHNSVNSSSLVYRKQAFLSAGLNDKKVDYGLEDYGHVISLLATGYRGVVIPETMFCYRVRSNSMYRSLTRHKALYSHQYLSSKYSDIYKEYASDIFNLMNANGPSFAYDNPSFGMRVSSVQQSDTGIVSNLKTFVKRNPALKKLLLQARAFIKI